MYREEAKHIDQATIAKIVAEAKSCTKSPWDIDLKLHPGDRLYHGHVDDSDVVNLEDSHEVSCEIAGKALECYKEKEGGDFELVEIKGRTTEMNRRYYMFHINFNAKPKYGDQSHMELFFAEAYLLLDNMDGDFIVNFCVMLDPSSPGVMEGCYHCVDMLHPIGYKFFCGPETAPRQLHHGESCLASRFSDIQLGSTFPSVVTC